MDKYDEYEKYLDFDEEYNSISHARGRDGYKTPRKGKKKPSVTLSDLTDFVDDASVWVPTYAAPLDPKHHERQWLIESLTPFYRDNVITDVTRRVKGGKEANVYCCIAHPAAERACQSECTGRVCQRIWLRKSLVRSWEGFVKKCSGVPSSTIVP